MNRTEVEAILGKSADLMGTTPPGPNWVRSHSFTRVLEDDDRPEIWCGPRFAIVATFDSDGRLREYQLFENKSPWNRFLAWLTNDPPATFASVTNCPSAPSPAP